MSLETLPQMPLCLTPRFLCTLLAHGHSLLGPSEPVRSETHQSARLCVPNCPQENWWTLPQPQHTRACKMGLLFFFKLQCPHLWDEKTVPKD